MKGNYWMIYLLGQKEILSIRTIIKNLFLEPVRVFVFFRILFTKLYVTLEKSLIF